MPFRRRKTLEREEERLKKHLLRVFYYNKRAFYGVLQTRLTELKMGFLNDISSILGDDPRVSKRFKLITNRVDHYLGLLITFAIFLESEKLQRLFYNNRKLQDIVKLKYPSIFQHFCILYFL